MPSDTELLEHMYDRFNARDMEAVLATMLPSVKWQGSVVGVRIEFAANDPAGVLARYKERRQAVLSAPYLLQMEKRARSYSKLQPLRC
jgi:hypothetical protein